MPCPEEETVLIQNDKSSVFWGGIRFTELCYVQVLKICVSFMTLTCAGKKISNNNFPLKKNSSHLKMLQSNPGVGTSSSKCQTRLDLFS